MERSEISKEQLTNLLKSILPIVLSQGPSHTSMDRVASSLGISKRTLYEIFGSKDAMLSEVLEYQYTESHRKAEEIFRTTDNMMEAMVKLMLNYQDVLEITSPVFFRDMDERFKHLRPAYDSKMDKRNSHLSQVIGKGIEQGMFREDCDLEMSLRLMRVQLESIKRMEDYFPPEITIVQAFYAIVQGFLRSIATRKGIEQLDYLTNKQIIKK